MQKVVFLHSQPMPHSIRLHNELHIRNLDVTFYYTKGITYLYPWKSLKKNFEYYVIRDFKTKLWLLRDSLKSDIVVISGWQSNLNIVLSIVLYVVNQKFVYWIDVPESLPNKGLNILFKRKLISLANALFVAGNKHKEEIADHFKFRKQVFSFPYLTCDNSSFQIENINMIRCRDLLDGERIRILVANRFEKRKGYDILINALNSLSDNIKQRLTIKIIGRGNDKPKYLTAINQLGIDSVILDWVEYETYLEALMACDIFIHSSIHENYGIPPIDAMKFGKCLIASDGVVSALDYVRHDYNGYLYRRNDSKELATLITYLSDNVDKIYEIGLNARNEFIEDDALKNYNVIKSIIY